MSTKDAAPSDQAPTEKAPAGQSANQPYPLASVSPVKADEPVAWYRYHAAAAASKEEVKIVRTEARNVFMQQFGQRCRDARGAREINDVAAAVGVHRNTIWNVERGDSLPDAFELEVLAREYNTTPTQLLGGEAQGAGRSAGVPHGVRAAQVDELIYVPLFDLREQAEGAAFTDADSVLAMRPFDAQFIRYDLGIAHDDLAMFGVVGASMEPWLHARDSVLADLRDRDALTEGVHLIRLDGALLMKRLQRLPGKILRVSSYNPAYEPFDIQGHESADRDFAVLGRVRWAGVTFN
ncbi:putative transcriptional regulator [Polaromonas sp. CF318]|uniref:XRE family transcriptional regulator n=1 Tax=Polaromonas sp. CF318 TaxID=1144318 RepID=UPI0002713D68|nr:LexA family transcriptional regulator [Polaromonas sp. CF318]EJL79059.1 putative transcriptional regulator [Polaromonas sp. CF318]